jgi:O-antigen ligase
MAFLKLQTVPYHIVIYYLLITFAFTLPLSRAAVSGLPIILLLIWIYDMVKEKKTTEYLTLILKQKPFFIFILFTIFALLSLFWSDMSGGVYKHIYKLFFYALIIPIVMITTLTNKEKSVVLTAFFAGMFISEIISYAIYFDLMETNTSRNSEFPVPFMSHIQYSTFLAVIASLLLVKLFSTDKWKMKLFYGLYLTMVVGNLFISGGRTGQLAFIGATLVVVLMSFKKKITAFFLSGIILFAILFTAYYSIDTFQNRVNLAKNDLINVYEKKQFCSSWGIRLGSYEVAFDLIKEAPLVGYGLFGHNDALKKLIDTKYPERACIKNHADFQNHFLLILVQFGIIGFILYLTFFLMLFKYQNHNEEFQKLKYIFIVIFFMFFISEGLIYQFSNALFAFLLALSFNNKNNQLP